MSQPQKRTKDCDPQQATESMENGDNELSASQSSTNKTDLTAFTQVILCQETALYIRTHNERLTPFTGSLSEYGGSHTLLQFLPAGHGAFSLSELSGLCTHAGGAVAESAGPDQQGTEGGEDQRRH